MPNRAGSMSIPQALHPLLRGHLVETSSPTSGIHDGCAWEQHRVQEVEPLGERRFVVGVDYRRDAKVFSRQARDSQARSWGGGNRLQGKAAAIIRPHPHPG